jgi:peptidyl-prolyl cis-trans isomerase D
MLASIRAIAKTWVARALFIVLIVALGLWGVAGSVRSIGTDTAVARVGGSRIEPADLQRALQQQVQRLQQQNGPGFQPSAALRQQLADQAAQQLVFQRLVDLELKHLRVSVPDAAVRQQVFGMRAFQNVSGQFDRQTFLSVLSRNGLDEQTFITLVRQDLGRQQLVGAVSAGVGVPDQMLGRIFAYSRETRIADAVDFPVQAATGVPSPTDAELHRFWANNPALYQTPEYRTVKLIVLSPDTLASDVTVSADDIKKYYDLYHATYSTPETRSLRIIAAPDQPTAAALATVWQGGATWGALQAAAKKVKATALELPDAPKGEVPDPALATAAFSASPNTVSQPVKGDFNWYVFQVTSVTPAKNVSLEEATPEIRRKVAVLKAADLMDDHVSKLEDAMAAGGGLDSLPQGLGVAAVQGTLDAQGNTPQGSPAPIPAWPALREAIVGAAFHAKPGTAPELEQLPPDKDHAQGAWYTVQVDHVTKPARQPFDTVTDRVRQDWVESQMRHIEETAAARLLTRVRSGTTLAAAAQGAGLTVRALPPVPRPFGDAQVPAGVPQNLVAPLFGMKQGDVAMVNTPSGFMVAQLRKIDAPTIASDPIGAGQLRTELSQSMGGDVVDTLIFALQQRYKVTLNPTLIHQIAQP